MGKKEVQGKRQHVGWRRRSRRPRSGAVAAPHGRPMRSRPCVEPSTAPVLAESPSFAPSRPTMKRGAQQAAAEAPAARRRRGPDRSTPPSTGWWTAPCPSWWASTRTAASTWRTPTAPRARCGGGGLPLPAQQLPGSCSGTRHRHHQPVPSAQPALILLALPPTPCSNTPACGSRLARPTPACSNPRARWYSNSLAR